MNIGVYLEVEKAALSKLKERRAVSQERGPSLDAGWMQTWLLEDLVAVQEARVKTLEALLVEAEKQAATYRRAERGM